mmetsp:Transcript_16722/g.31820  ORF Transcript_16722/g.31820 Transcript_16722/m.31820 type:complete len:233 (+) Transcript_16722:158-856(+)
MIWIINERIFLPMGRENPGWYCAKMAHKSLSADTTWATVTSDRFCRFYLKQDAETILIIAQPIVILGIRWNCPTMWDKPIRVPFVTTCKSTLSVDSMEMDVGRRRPAWRAMILTNKPGLIYPICPPDGTFRVWQSWKTCYMPFGVRAKTDTRAPTTIGYWIWPIPTRGGKNKPIYPLAKPEVILGYFHVSMVRPSTLEVSCGGMHRPFTSLIESVVTVTTNPMDLWISVFFD